MVITTITNAVALQLQKGTASFLLLVGHADDPKIRPSFRNFERVAREMRDEELQTAVRAVMLMINEAPEDSAPTVAAVPPKKKKNCL